MSTPTNKNSQLIAEENSGIPEVLTDTSNTRTDTSKVSETVTVKQAQWFFPSKKIPNTPIEVFT